MTRIALLTGIVWLGTLIPAVADEPPSIFDRWQALEVAARAEAKKYPAPQQLFADGEAYRKAVAASNAESVAYRRKLAAECKELLAEGERRAGELAFDDQLAMAVLAARADRFDAAQRHAEAAQRAKPDDPRVLLILMLAQLRQKDVDAAATTLAQVAEGAPLPDEDWTRSYLNMVNNLFRGARRSEAISRSGRWQLDFSRSANPRTAVECFGSVNGLRLAAMQMAHDGAGALALADVEREQLAWERLDHPYKPWALQRLVALRVELLAMVGKKEEARGLLDKALAEARQRRDDAPHDANACLRLLVLERTQLDLLPPDEVPAARKLVADALHAGIRRFPGDAMAIEFGQGAGKVVLDLVRDGEYQAAEAERDAVLETLRSLPADFQTSPALHFAYYTAYLPNEQIERRLARNELLGKPAPPLEVSAWVNGSPLAADDLRGKVVLVDFWAVWCGPCIRAFPDLIDWHRQYAGRGLVMVGVTRYYGYGWDAENSRPKSFDALSHADEQTAIAAFAKHHELPYPLALDDDARMSNRFGVEGIPQVVLIDRKGTVRLVRVGTSEANAKEIAEKIETLLGE